MAESRWVSIDELLEWLPNNWSKKYIYYKVRTKKIPHCKPSPGKLMFNLDVIDEWLKTKMIEVEEG